MSVPSPSSRTILRNRSATLEYASRTCALDDVLCGLVEQIGDFGIGAEPLPRRRDDDVLARGIPLEDLLHAAKIIAVRKGRAAELADLNHR